MLKLLSKAAICAALAAPALAASPPLPAERTISTAGVDFTDRAQALAFYGRLHAAAEAVCDGYVANSRVTQAEIACIDRTIAEVVRKLDKPTLTALYDRRQSTLLAGR